MLQGDAEYFGLLLIKSSDLQLLKWSQKEYFTSVHYEIAYIVSVKRNRS